jgi:polysaccharide biosynthesis protein PslH
VKILFVTTDLPVPPNSGRAIRSISIIQALQANGHELTFVSFAKKGRPSDLYPLSTYCHSIDLLEFDIKNLTEQTDRVQRLKCLLSLKSYSVERFRSKAMRARIREQLTRRKYDLIVCDGMYALANIPVTKIPIILNCHNVEYIILRRYAQLERHLAIRLYAKIESYLLRNAERNCCHRIAYAMVCSEIDLAAMRLLRPDLAASVVPNVVDTDFIHPVETAASDNAHPVLLFQGSMDWYPNRDAVEYCVQSILPMIRQDFPNARFIVAGRNPPPQFVERFSLDLQIEFTGTVPDMRPYLAAATVVIVPLRIGGGTRIKILEACAAGKPTVSTTVGAEGLDLKAGREIILADDAAEFARSVVTLLRDPDLRDAIARPARSAVVERYSQLALKKALEDIRSNLQLGKVPT